MGLWEDDPMTTMTELNKRMSDKVEIPPLNGTVAKLVELAAAPLETPEQQQIAIRELIKLNLHSYLMIKQTLQAVQDSFTLPMQKVQDTLILLTTERKSIIDKLIDKFLVPLVYTIITAGVYYILRQP